jgi:hypothetical protein
MNIVQKNYLEARAMLDLLLETYYKQANEISARYGDTEDDAELDAMFEEHEVARSALGIHPLELIMMDAEEDLLSWLKAEAKSAKLLPVFKQLAASPEDLNILFTRGTRLVHTRKKLLDLALRYIG